MDGMEGGEEEASPRVPRPAKTPERVARFLDALRSMPLVNRAARAAGVAPRTVYDWRQQDPEFRAAWAEALDEGVERIEAVAHAAALHGSDREATLQRIFVLKRHRPEYRDNVTVRHQGGGQDARDAALLRRAMVEALGPYPEARAALASTLARLAAGAVATGEPAGVDLDRDHLAHVQAAGRELAEGATSPPGAGAGAERGRGGARPAGGGGPVQAASPTTPALQRGPILEVVDAEVVDDDEGSGDKDSGG